MSNAIEIEAKALINAQEYKKLVKAYSEYHRYTQTNYYIDNEDRDLGKEGIGLRIREKDGDFTLTLKTPLSQGLLEKNEPISQKVFEDFRDKGIFPKTDMVRFLTMMGFDVNTLRIITYLTTDRIDVEYKEGLLSIDKNIYSGITDYEVELEYNSMEGAIQGMEEFFTSHGMVYVCNKANKVTRALRAFDNKKKEQAA